MSFRLRCLASTAYLFTHWSRSQLQYSSNKWNVSKFQSVSSSSSSSSSSSQSTANPLIHNTIYPCGDYSNDSRLNCSKKDDNSALREKLFQITEDLTRNLPKFFTNQQNFTYYHHDVIVENEFTGKTTVGLYKFVMKMNLFKIMSHIKYAYIRMHVLHIVPNPEDMSITIRWRICGVTALKAIFAVLKEPLKQWKQTIVDKEIWHDGITKIYLSDKGLVHRVVIIKYMTDTNRPFQSDVLKKTIAAISFFPNPNIALDEYLPMLN